MSICMYLSVCGRGGRSPLFFDLPCLFTSAQTLASVNLKHIVFHFIVADHVLATATLAHVRGSILLEFV